MRDKNPKAWFGTKKPSMRCIPPAFLLHVGAVMDQGARKYGLFNWRKDAVCSSTYVDALLRHMAAWVDGEDYDLLPDPDHPGLYVKGEHHLAHVAACCAIILDAEACEKLDDDRGHPGPAADLIRSWSTGAPAPIRNTVETFDENALAQQRQGHEDH